LAYFDPLGYSVLNQKERTTVERKIKQLLKDHNNDLENVVNNRNSQMNSIQTPSSSSVVTSEDNQSTNKSTFASFISSVSTSTTRKHTTYTSANKTNSIADEFLLYKSLGSKEVETIIQTDSNSDASLFW